MKSTKQTNLIVLLVLTFLIFCITPSLAQQESEFVIIRNTTKEASHSLTNAEANALSHAAGLLLWHIDSAREKLFAVVEAEEVFNNLEAVELDELKQSVKVELEQAQLLIDIINSAAPIYTIQTTLSTSDLDYDLDTIVQPVIIPIYEELLNFKVLSRIQDVKQSAALKAANAGIPLELIDTQLDYTKADIDIQTTQLLLNRALDNLTKDQLVQSDNDLKDIQLTVNFKFIDNHISLLKARQELYNAQQMMRSDNLVKSKIALSNAFNALAKYQKTLLPSSDRYLVIESLLTDIQLMNKNLKTHISDHKDTTIIKLVDWWILVNNWLK